MNIYTDVSNIYLQIKLITYDNIMYIITFSIVFLIILWLIFDIITL